MRRIAVEEAFITPAIRDGWKEILDGGQAEPGFAKMGGSLMGPGGQVLFERLLGFGAARVAHMDSVGIDFSVLSLTSPGVQVFDADRATHLAAESNDLLAAEVANHPDRLAGLVAVAPQDPAAAVREIERGRRLGMRGIIINSSTRSEYLDLPRFWPILEAAAALDMPIYLHPREPASSMVTPYLDYGLYFATWGFSAETGLHVLRLMMSGVLDRFPKLRIVLGHMGEGVPFWLKRIDNRHALQVKLGAVPALPREPSAYFLDHFVVTTAGVTSMPSLRHCLDVLGVERILFAADYPYEDDAEAVRFLDGATITAAERRAIYETNAMRVFGLPSGR